VRLPFSLHILPRHIISSRLQPTKIVIDIAVIVLISTFRAFAFNRPCDFYANSSLRTGFKLGWYWAPMARPDLQQVLPLAKNHFILLTQEVLISPHTAIQGLPRLHYRQRCPHRHWVLGMAR
jgi:hypothetical protein